jgi:hypothetical protein
LLLFILRTKERCYNEFVLKDEEFEKWFFCAKKIATLKRRVFDRNFWRPLHSFLRYFSIFH